MAFSDRLPDFTDSEAPHGAIHGQIIALSRSRAVLISTGADAHAQLLTLELNVSQKILATRFGVSEQTIARYEKGKSEIPRTTDAALRVLYMESLEKNNPVGYFLDLLSDVEASKAAKRILLEERQEHWEIAA